MVTTQLRTAEDLFQMNSDSDEFELIRGELVPMSPASGDHGRIRSEIHGLLWTFLRNSQVGKAYIAETGFLIEQAPDTVFAPDVAIVRNERLTSTPTKGFVPCPPDLAVEVESPSHREGKMLAKVALYLQGGAQQVWLVRPLHRSVTVFRPGVPELVLYESDTLSGGDLLPGFELILAELFAVLGPDE